MITFKKINDMVADIYNDTEKIGHIENLHNGYNVEVMYLRTHLTHDNSKMVVDYVKKLYQRLEARKIRAAKPLRNFNEFKILD